MSYKVLFKRAFKIIGISTKTGNGHAASDIATLWQRWFSEGIAEKIPNKVSEEVLNLYYEYETDQNGAYTVLLGCRVENLDTIPEGLDGDSFHSHNYAVYKHSGKLPETVIDTWKSIRNETNYLRTFIVDFDIYDLSVGTPDDMPVISCVSVE